METWSKFFPRKDNAYDRAESFDENTPFFEIHTSPSSPRLYTLTVKGVPVGMDLDSQDNGINAFVKKINYADLISNVTVQDVAFDSNRSVESVVQIGDQLVKLDKVELEDVPFSFIMDIIKSKTKILDGEGSWTGTPRAFTLTFKRKVAGEIDLVDFSQQQNEDKCQRSVRSSVTGRIGKPKLSARVDDDVCPLMIMKIVGFDHLQIVDSDTVFYRVQVAYQNGKSYIVSKRFSHFVTLLFELKTHYIECGMTINLEQLPKDLSRLPLFFRFQKEEAFVKDRIDELNEMCARLIQIADIHSTLPLKKFLSRDKPA